MRLLVVGRLSGQLASAVKMAMAHGAKVNHVERADQATEQLRRGQGADLLMVDYNLDIAGLIAANELERIFVPVVACGVANVGRYRDLFRSLPAFVSTKESGAGFAEIAETLLKKRAG